MLDKSTSLSTLKLGGTIIVVEICPCTDPLEKDWIGLSIRILSNWQNDFSLITRFKKLQ